MPCLMGREREREKTVMMNVSPCNSDRSNLSQSPPPLSSSVGRFSRLSASSIVAGHGGESVCADCDGEDLESSSETSCGHALACIHVLIGHRKGCVWTLPCCSCSLDAHGAHTHTQICCEVSFGLHRPHAAVIEQLITGDEKYSNQAHRGPNKKIRPIYVSAACKHSSMFKHPLGQREYVYWNLVQRLPRDPQQFIDFRSADFDLTESVVSQQAAHPTCVSESVPQVIKSPTQHACYCTSPRNIRLCSRHPSPGW